MIDPGLCKKWKEPYKLTVILLCGSFYKRFIPLGADLIVFRLPQKFGYVWHGNCYSLWKTIPHRSNSEWGSVVNLCVIWSTLEKELCSFLTHNWLKVYLEEENNTEIDWWGNSILTYVGILWKRKERRLYLQKKRRQLRGLWMEILITNGNG